MKVCAKYAPQQHKFYSSNSQSVAVKENLSDPTSPFFYAAAALVTPFVYRRYIFASFR